MRNVTFVLVITGFLISSGCSPASSGRMDHTQMNHGMMRQDNTVDASGTSTLLSGKDIDLSTLPEAKPSQVLEVNDGETIDLNPQIVKKTISGKSFAFYAYNGQFPGPTIKAKQGSTFTVRVKNDIDQPTTVHWHGIRLDNRFDGAAGVTQDAIEPGGSFTYTVTVPDEGMYWYHPHVREDVQQDLGLYGLLHVLPQKTDAYSPVDREETVILDDILLQDGLPVAYGKQEADHALMGRFGNTLLVNGNKPQPMQVGLGSTVRFFLLNASNTRTYRIVKPAGSVLKIVGGDAGRYAQEYITDAIALSPSERLTVDVYFWDDGVNKGNPATKTVTLAEAGPPSQPAAVLSATIVGGVTGGNQLAAAQKTASHVDVVADIADFREYFDKPVDKTLRLTVKQAMMGEMGHGMMMNHGATSDGIEWEDAMPMMNTVATKANTQWKLIDGASGKENMDIRYEFKRGDKVKIRIVNDKTGDGSDHPMQHPIHFHGQRFLVLTVNGTPNEHLVWKDTTLVPKDGTVDILLDVTNPGDWMIHCHIAEHLTNGMMGMFTVQ